MYVACTSKMLCHTSMHGSCSVMLHCCRGKKHLAAALQDMLHAQESIQVAPAVCQSPEQHNRCKDFAVL
jgi:hypothetical protein